MAESPPRVESDDNKKRAVVANLGEVALGEAEPRPLGYKAGEVASDTLGCRNM